jgi:hypothetical protein
VDGFHGARDACVVQKKDQAGEREMLTVCPLYHLPKAEDETKKERGDRATSRHGLFLDTYLNGRVQDQGILQVVAVVVVVL